MLQEGTRFFTSESVTEGHPDKVCDQISDAILDAHLAQDPMARVACETIATTGMVLVIAIRLLAAHFRWNLPRVHSRLRERAEDTHNTGIAGASGDGQKG